MKLRLSVKIVMIVYLLILISFVINWFCFDKMNLWIIAFTWVYPVIYHYFFYCMYKYLFVRQDVEQVFPGKTLDLLIANSDVYHDCTDYDGYLNRYGIEAKCAGLDVFYRSDYSIINRLSINHVNIPYYYDAYSKIVSKINKRIKTNRDILMQEKQQEIINNLKN